MGLIEELWRDLLQLGAQMSGYTSETVTLALFVLGAISVGVKVGLWAADRRKSSVSVVIIPILLGLFGIAVAAASLTYAVSAFARISPVEEWLPVSEAAEKFAPAEALDQWKKKVSIDPLAQFLQKELLAGRLVAQGQLKTSGSDDYKIIQREQWQYLRLYGANLSTATSEHLDYIGLSIGKSR